MYRYENLQYEATGQRSCYTPGLVYRYDNNRQNRRGLMEDDLLLCIKKSGDCHYEFVRIEETGETSDSTLSLPLRSRVFYYKLHQKTATYGGMEIAFPNMEPLTPTALVHVLYSDQLLIPMAEVLTDEEKTQLENAIKASQQLNEFHLRPRKR